MGIIPQISTFARGSILRHLEPGIWNLESGTWNLEFFGSAGTAFCSRGLPADLQSNGDRASLCIPSLDLDLPGPPLGANGVLQV